MTAYMNIQNDKMGDYDVTIYPASASPYTSSRKQRAVKIEIVEKDKDSHFKPEPFILYMTMSEWCDFRRKVNEQI